MSIIARHKKPGAFRKLVNFLETTAPEKQKLIIEAMRKEDPDFMGQVEDCLFRFEEFMPMDDMVICEIIGAMKKEMRTVALALYHSEPAMIEKFVKNMRPPEHFEFKEMTEGFKSVLSREQLAARFRIIEKARDLERAGKIVLKKYSSHWADIE